MGRNTVSSGGGGGVGGSGEGGAGSSGDNWLCWRWSAWWCLEGCLPECLFVSVFLECVPKSVFGDCLVSPRVFFWSACVFKSVWRERVAYECLPGVFQECVNRGSSGVLFHECLLGNLPRGAKKRRFASCKRRSSASPGASSGEPFWGQTLLSDQRKKNVKSVDGGDKHGQNRGGWNLLETLPRGAKKRRFASGERVRGQTSLSDWEKNKM